MFLSVPFIVGVVGMERGYKNQYVSLFLNGPNDRLPEIEQSLQLFFAAD